jgi:Tfp pilus assembly protein PilX
MARKGWLFALILLVLAVVIGIVGFRLHERRVRDARTKASAAAQAKAALRRAVQRESDELVIGSHLRSVSIRIRTLALEDEMARLVGRTAKNRVAIAGLENELDEDAVLESAQMIWLSD